MNTVTTQKRDFPSPLALCCQSAAEADLGGTAPAYYCNEKMARTTKTEPLGLPGARDLSGCLVRTKSAPLYWLRGGSWSARTAQGQPHFPSLVHSSLTGFTRCA